MIKAKRTAISGGFFVAIAASGWGTWSLFLKPAEARSQISPALEVLILQVVMCVSMALPALFSRESKARSARTWMWLCLFALSNSLNNVFFFWAMQRTSLAIAVLSHYLAPIFVALSAPRLLNERASKATLACLSVALLGLCLLLEPWNGEALKLSGAGLGALSALFYAINVLVLKFISRDFRITELVFYVNLPAPLLLAPFISWSAPLPSLDSLLYLGLGGLLPGTLCGLLFAYGIARIPASHAALLTLLEPVVAVILGVMVWNEPMSAVRLLGGVLVLFAAYFVMRSRGADPSSSP